MINLALTAEEFAAKRRKAQDNFITRLLPFATAAIKRLGDGLENWSDDLTRQVQRLYELAYGDEGGEHIPREKEFVASIRRALNKTTPESSPENLAVWLSIAVINSAAIQAARDDSEELFIEWVTMHDTHVRHAHRLTNGEQRPIGEPFNVDGTPMMFPGDSTAPVELWINCVVGSTNVSWTGQEVLAATRRVETGTFVKITTTRGHVLTVTANHPVLTTTGYVPASLLTPSDYLLATWNGGEPQVDDTPTSAEEVFGALSKVGAVERVGSGRVDFHGNRPAGEVEVVRANCDLTGPLWTERGNPFFVGPSVAARYLPGSGVSDHVAPATLAVWQEVVTAAALLSGNRQLAPLVQRQSLHPEFVGVTTGANRQFHVDETPYDEGSADTEFAAHLQNALTIGMTPCKVGKVNVHEATHQVYNLNTSGNAYSANGIAVHNCRCTVRPVLASEAITATGGTMDNEKPDTHLVVTHNSIPWHGVLAPEGVASGDGRKFASGSLSHRPLPMPLTWQKTSDDGHKGNVTVAKIEKVAMKDGLMHASGHFIDNPEADEVIGLLGEFGRFGVSVDADSTAYDLDENAEELVFTSARVSSACIVPIPAFAEAYVCLGEHPELDVPEDQSAMPAAVKDPALVAGLEQMKRGAGWITNPVATKRIHDYWTVPGQPGYAKVAWGTEGDFNRCRVEIGQEIAEKSPEKLRFINQQCAQWQHDAIGIWPGRGEAAAAETLELSSTDVAPALTLVASAGIKAPAAWFANPHLEALTPLTVTEDGQVFGHIAAWDACHLGFQDMCVAPPHSSSDYSYFLSGEVLLNDGTSVPVGNITIGGGHADTSLGMKSALAHYDNTSTAAADICVGEDAHGIWCAGWIRPGTPPEMVYALRASALSGDWRSRPGGSQSDLELIAALAVNVPGFGIPRIRAAAANGKQVSLVASGVVAPTEETKAEVAGWDLDALAASVAKHMAVLEGRREKMLALASRVNGAD